MKSNISSFIIYLGTLTLIVFSCTKEKEKPPGPVTDIDGNSYKTVKIGTQVWMAENLKTTLFNDGTLIPLVTNTDTWGNLSTPGYCWYNNDEDLNKNIYGALYNGYAVSSGILCPTGWHVPNLEEWQKLREYLGDTISGGSKMKETGISHWHTPNKGATNSSGFTALPAGIRYFEGTFSAETYYTGFWSSTETDSGEEWYLSLYYGETKVSIGYRIKKHGFSIRCVKD
jgi:uncharacterized protein (TIGR02145 family)